MPEIILHHYPLSPFSEKVRLTCGLKQLAWRSVVIDLMPPRPELEPLTGGYRRVPVMQIGADIFCDTQIILRTIERLHPTPSLFPDGTESLATAVAWWWERSIWNAAVGLLGALIGDRFPEAFIRDRKEGYLGFDMSKRAMLPQLPRNRQRIQAQMTWFIGMLGDGRRFLLGDALSAADLAVYQVLWVLRANANPEIDRLLPMEPLLPWYERIAQLGHGSPTELSPAQALQIAAEATPAEPAAAVVDTAGLERGQRVTVTPDDNARVPVAGTLLAADAHEVVIRRTDLVAGEINVHFPRAGFDVLPDDSGD
jgi:glutathione S-transferase